MIGEYARLVAARGPGNPSANWLRASSRSTARSEPSGQPTAASEGHGGDARQGPMPATPVGCARPSIFSGRRLRSATLDSAPTGERQRGQAWGCGTMARMMRMTHPPSCRHARRPGRLLRTQVPGWPAGRSIPACLRRLAPRSGSPPDEAIGVRHELPRRRPVRCRRRGRSRGRDAHDVRGPRALGACHRRVVRHRQAARVPRGTERCLHRHDVLGCARCRTRRGPPRRARPAGDDGRAGGHLPANVACRTDRGSGSGWPGSVSGSIRPGRWPAGS